MDTAWDLARDINDTARVKCGYATIHDIETHALYDSMDSFWMSETLKYLYLLFRSDDETYFINSDRKYKDLLFTTEGHPIPLNVVHRIWNEQMKGHNETKHDFWSRYHWWNLDPFWENFWSQIQKQHKFHFMSSNQTYTQHNSAEDRAQWMLLVKNYLKFIGNDQILHEEYHKMQVVITNEAQEMVWDVDKLRTFKETVYDAESGQFYKKKGMHRGSRYDDEWIQLGAKRFWDCGRLLELRKKVHGGKGRKKKEEKIFKLWSLRDCDSYVHSKCWTHRFVDDTTCWT